MVTSHVQHTHAVDQADSWRGAVMNIKSLLAALVVSLSLVAPVLAGPMEDAVQGNVTAQCNVGQEYLRGEGVLQDYEKAVEWIRKAAEHNDAICQFILGKLYAEGKAVPTNYVEAHKWYNLSSSQDQGGSGGWTPERLIKRMERDALEGRMTHSQIAEAQRLAREWKPKK